MSKSAKILKEVGKLSTTEGVDVTVGSVTQLTNITTAVTLNSSSGIITTISATTAGAASSTFTVNNSKVTAGSLVLASISDYAGTFSTNGIPVVNIDGIAAGSFTVNISNTHASNALSGVLKIHFLVL